MKILHVLFTTSIAVAVATPSGGRSSETPRILQRQAGNQSSSSSLQPNFTHAQLWDLNTKFLDAFIYPANVKEAKAINSTILAEDVQGRVDITRTFNGRELNTEYLFGLFANLAAADAGAISLLGIPLSYEVLHFAASQNVVAALTRYVLFYRNILPLACGKLMKSWHPGSNSTSRPSTSFFPSTSTPGTPTTAKAKSPNTTPPSNTGNGSSTT